MSTSRPSDFHDGPLAQLSPLGVRGTEASGSGGGTIPARRPARKRAWRTPRDSLSLLLTYWFGWSVFRLRELHPYEMPEIIAIPVETALPEYLGWVMENSHRPA